MKDLYKKGFKILFSIAGVTVLSAAAIAQQKSRWYLTST